MALSPGSTLQNGKYKLQQTLGKGGFGLTYRAEHTVFQASLVLKSPNDDLRADPEYPKFVARFLKEGKTLWNLSQQRHPHIVRVTDLFEERGVPWLVMDYIRGESLFDRVQRKGALPEAEVVGFIQQMGSALLAVHGAGLVHRDAHPGNIMILPPDPTKIQREAILIDFGIAGEMFPSTVSSKFLGNPAFAPYEQFGMPADPLMDVYTLAASCYFAVTGVLPESAMNRKLYGRGLVAPRQHRGTLSQGLNAAILAGMALEAGDRPSLSEWLQLLQPQSSGVNPQPPPAVPTWSVEAVPLRSEKGVDYTRLRDLLKAGQWQEADQETLKLMLEATGRTKKRWFLIWKGWFRPVDLLSFPCADLKTIDQLWVRASQGRYGFSIQKEIYVKCGGKLDAWACDHRIWDKFCKEVGWSVNNSWWDKFCKEVGWPVNNSWVDYANMDWNNAGAIFHLPSCVWVSSINRRRLWSRPLLRCILAMCVGISLEYGGKLLGEGLVKLPLGVLGMLLGGGLEFIGMLGFVVWVVGSWGMVCVMYVSLWLGVRQPGVMEALGSVEWRDCVCLFSRIETCEV